jgi:hypothetical protein
VSDTAFSIYALCDPESMEIRYVGKTWCPLAGRLRRHFAQVKASISGKSSYHAPVHDWLNSLMQKGSVPVVRCFAKTFNPKRACELEKEFTQFFYSIGHRILNLMPRRDNKVYPGSPHRVKRSGIGRKLFTHRVNSHLTLQMLSKKCDIPVRTLFLLEGGKRAEIGMVRVVRLAKELNISVSEVAEEIAACFAPEPAPLVAAPAPTDNTVSSATATEGGQS